MTKRIFAICLAIFLALQTISAEAAVKAGTSCKTLGITSIASGKTFTCIKSGKKLIWDKGIKTRNTSPAVQSPNAIVQPTSFDDLVKNYQGIASAAWSKSKTQIQSGSGVDTKLKLIVGPNSKLIYKDPLKAMNLINRLYANYPYTAEINFVVFNYQDRDWAIKQMDSIIPSAGSEWVSRVACATQATCWGGGSFFDGSNKFLIMLTSEINDLNHTSGTLEAHEYTHIVQQMSISKNRPAQEFLYDPWPPTWYWEGQAHFAQHAAIYSDSFEKYLDERKNTAGELFSDSIYTSEYIEKYFVFNAPADWQKNYIRWNQYDLGAMFVEILTALKGPTSTMEMWKLARNGMPFPAAFESIYGISFSKALPIMAKAIALELGKN